MIQHLVLLFCNWLDSDREVFELSPYYELIPRVIFLFYGMIILVYFNPRLVLNRTPMFLVYFA